MKRNSALAFDSYESGKKMHYSMINSTITEGTFDTEYDLVSKMGDWFTLEQD